MNPYNNSWTRAFPPLGDLFVYLPDGTIQLRKAVRAPYTYQTWVRVRLDMDEEMAKNAAQQIMAAMGKELITKETWKKLFRV